MDAAFIQALQGATSPEDKAALVAEASLSTFSNEVARVARQCVLFHWFDQSIVEGLLLAVSLNAERAQEVYTQITSLPFVEQLPWGVAYQDLTRQGLLKHYIRTQPELLKAAANVAAPLYRAFEENAAEALFCFIISGDILTSVKLLNTLLEQAMAEQNWLQMESLFRLQGEAEQFPFIGSIPRTEQYWLLRSIVDQVNGMLEEALIDYDHALIINPKSALAYLGRSIVRERQHNYDQARADYEEAFRLDQTIMQALSKKDALAPSLNQTKKDDRATNKLIIVIDDSLTVRKIIEMTLRREGFEVKTFPDGIEAIHWLGESQSRVPSLVILDIGLPKMDGYEVARHLKARPQFSNTVIIILSQRDGINDLLKGRLVGAKDYITKPFSSDDLIARVHFYLSPERSSSTKKSSGEDETIKNPFHII